MNHRHLCLAALAAAITVQGCAVQPATQAVAADELLDGQAKTCTASTPDRTSGPSVQATIAMTNDGWCGVYVTDKDAKPFKNQLIVTRATHGRVYVQKVNSRTRIEYTPFARYTGTDQFSVTLRPVDGGAETMVQVAVTVTPGATPAVAEPATKPSTTKPATARTTKPRRTTPAR